jgi:hypothetical protein
VTKNGNETIAATPTVKSQKQEAKPKRAIKQVVLETPAAVEAQFPKFKDSQAAWYRSQARQGLPTGTPIMIPDRSRK